MTGKAKVAMTREFIKHAITHMDGSPSKLPEDSELVGIDYNAERDIFECVFVSQEWPETMEGELVKRVNEVQD
jgi:hypothetical protein